MRPTEAYTIFNGELFHTEERAQKREDDLLGMELDGLLKLFSLDITRNQEYKALLQLIDRKEELKISLKAILNILEF